MGKDFRRLKYLRNEILDFDSFELIYPLLQKKRIEIESDTLSFPCIFKNSIFALPPRFHAFIRVRLSDVGTTKFMMQNSFASFYWLGSSEIPIFQLENPNEALSVLSSLLS